MMSIVLPSPEIFRYLALMDCALLCDLLAEVLLLDVLLFGVVVVVLYAIDEDILLLND